MKKGLVNPVTNTYVLDNFDAPYYAFIPRNSALDYTVPTGGGLDYDITSATVAANMSRTPFDVIVGGFNYWHPGLRADLVSDAYIDATYLNREIGDQDMYLDNIDINRKGIYQAEKTIS